MQPDLVDVSIITCLPGHYQCKDRTCILDILLCYGFPHCSSEDDELDCYCTLSGNYVANSTFCLWDCRAPKCKCSDFNFQCKLGGSVSYSFICDGIVNCLHHDSDELCGTIERLKH